MSCGPCAQHRAKIKEAVKSGSVTQTAVETARALNTFNSQMVNKFKRVATVTLKRK